MVLLPVSHRLAMVVSKSLCSKSSPITIAIVFYRSCLGVMAEQSIGKFYVGPIQMADLRSHQSTGIYLWLLLIHLWLLSIHFWVLFLTSVWLWSYSEPNCRSMILFRAGLWINDPVQSRIVDWWIHWVWYDLRLSAWLNLKSPKYYFFVTLISRWVCLWIFKCTSWNKFLLWHSAKFGVTLSYFEI